MNPAIRHAEEAGVEFVLHEFEPAADTKASLESASFVDDLRRVFQTLIVKLDDARLAMAIVPLPSQLDLKALAKAAGAKKAGMAPPAEAERATGYVLGGISPLGQKRQLPAFLDASALNHATILVSGGRRGLELELSPDALANLTAAIALEISR